MGFISEMRGSIPPVGERVGVHWSVGDKNTGEIVPGSNTACYGTLKYYPEGFRQLSPTHMISTIRYLGRDLNEIERELAIKWLDWVLNRSPWAFMFKAKSAVYALNKGFITSMGNKLPADLLLQGMCAARMAIEVKVPLSWESLVEKGVGELEAFFIAHMFQKVSRGFYVKQGGYSHHGCMSINSCTPEVFMNMSLGVWKTKRPPFSKDVQLKRLCGPWTGDSSSEWPPVQGELGYVRDSFGRQAESLLIKEKNIVAFGRDMKEIAKGLLQ